MKKIFVNQLKAGDLIDDIFLLDEKSMGRKRDGMPYMMMTLSDKTGRVKGVVWDNAEAVGSQCAAGDFVKVEGNVSEYKGVNQVVVKTMNQCSSGVEPSDFLPASRRNPEQMFDRLKTVVDTIQTDCLRKLFEAFWNDPDFVFAFKIAPAAKLMHHAYLGGLLEHSLSVTLLADRVADHYAGIDRDLLVAGAVLHDIGKVREFRYATNIDYSDEGRLVSHIVIGVGMLEEKLACIDNFPPQTALLLKHMIVSHHGSKEFGSPEPPKTLESVLLNYLDDIDSKVNGIREFMNSQDSDSDWTGYHRPLERFFYKPKTAVDN